MELTTLWFALVDWLSNGVLQASWWQIVVYTLVVTHLTIASVTIFLHRAQAHRALELGPVPSHFFRFWLWLTTGMVTKEWVAIHRKHHAKCETEEDPHSPQTRGLKALLLTGAELYRAEAKNAETIQKYGHNTPDDWLERQLYSGRSALGVSLLLIANVLMFGAIGLTVWAVQMIWIPLMATAIINGIGHYWGYRNFEAADASTNVSPWASSSAARSCTTTTTPSRPRRSCRSSPTSSTSAGCTSAASRCWAGPRCARPRRSWRWAT